MTAKKVVVISAPMGSGKTEQVVSLILGAFSNDKSVLVVSFRQFLATQQALRLGIECYLDMDTREMQEGPNYLTCCLNSIHKIGPKQYDYIILDECGIIR